MKFGAFGRRSTTSDDIVKNFNPRREHTPVRADQIARVNLGPVVQQRGGVDGEANQPHRGSGVVLKDEKIDNLFARRSTTCLLRDVDNGKNLRQYCDSIRQSNLTVGRQRSNRQFSSGSLVVQEAQSLLV